MRKEVKPSPPAAAIVDEERGTVNHIGEKVNVATGEKKVPELVENEQVATSPSIHDLLNEPEEVANTSTSNNITEFQGEQQLESISTEESLSIPPAAISIEQEEDKEEPNDKDVDNPPSLILDVNFNVSPSVTNLSECFGEFNEEIIEEGDDNVAFETPPREESISPIGEEQEQLPMDNIVNEQKQTSDEVVPEFQEAETIVPQAAEEDEFGDFVENEVDQAANLVHSEDPTDGSEESGNNCDFKEEIIEISGKSVQKESAAAPFFDDFSDFTSAAGQSVVGMGIESKTSAEWQSSEAAEPQAVEFEADFNQFANFDDFPQVVDDTVINPKVVGLEQTEAEEDDDDDFGDFASSVPVVTLPELLLEEKLPDIDISNVDGILREMFPENNVVVGESPGNRAPNRSTKTLLVEVNGYETTALTNEYHWSKSYSKKCLVKCLGIDTRNIVSG